MSGRAILACLALFAVLSILTMPFIGMEAVPLEAVLHPDSGTESTIFWHIRVPRVLTAFAAGTALGVCGMAFQAIFRNPLATPFTLGVSSGASLGAAIALQLGLTGSLLGIPGTSAFGFLGALLCIGVIYGLTRLKEGFSTATMLLAGVAMSFFISSIIMFMQYTADYYDSFRLLRWLMGGLGEVGFNEFLNVLPFAVLGAASMIYYSNELNLLTTGDDLAMSRGVDVLRTKKLLFLSTSVTVGGVVAECGPIGFVGMMAPHICRMLIGPDHRLLGPATCLFGGAFLAVCDTFARTVMAPAQLPVGVVTAFLGGPFFLWLLLSGSAERHFP